MSLLEEMVARWSSPDARPLFKGVLIDAHGCCCAQGDVLRMCGWTDSQLYSMKQATADREVARRLGISLTHSILLRQVNDRADGCPQDVLAHPERILGDQAQRILSFWRRLDVMTSDQWEAARKLAWGATRIKALVAARAAAGAAASLAWDAAWAAAWSATGAAAGASMEIQGAAKLRIFFFLPAFGINYPDQLD